MRPGDLFLIFLIWYAVVRFALETLRTGNWTFFGTPTAMLISGGIIAGSLAILAIRHRPGAAGGDRWGDAPEPGWDKADDGDDDEWVDADADEDEDEAPVAGTPAAVAPASAAPVEAEAGDADDVDAVDDEGSDGDDTPGEPVDAGPGPGDDGARAG